MSELTVDLVERTDIFSSNYSLHSLMIDILPKLKNSYMIDIFRLHLEFPRRRLFHFVFAITLAPRMKRQQCHPSALAP